MVNPELRKHLPVLPGKDDIFTKMSLLFVEAFEEIERLELLLDIRHINHNKSAYIADMPMRYLDIIKEYQEHLFSQPAPEEVQK